MGVPKFFRYISERYPCLSELAREHSIPEFDNLYLDMNGIVHNCSHPDDTNIHFHLEETQIFQDIYNYIDKLFYLIKPQKLFFLAVDGVAPRAKMNQQRSRRFRSAREAEVLESKALQRGEKRQHERFDSNCITPGTAFMHRLQNGLRCFLRTKMTTDPLWQKCRIILSGQETPGEGEHKIMDYIRFMKAQPNFDPNTRHCLYGLDADLIILGLCTHELHFVVLREEVKFGRNVKRTAVEETRFFLLHLGLLREYLELEFDQMSTPERKVDVAQLVDDWVLMGFLVGNDFVPNLPFLHISSNALPLLYKTYMDIYPQLGGNINEQGKLNLKRLEQFMKALSEVEMQVFEEQSDKLKSAYNKNEAFDVDVEELRNRDNDLAALIDNSMKMYEDDSDVDFSDEDSAFQNEFQNYKRNYYRNKFKHEMHGGLIAELGHHYVTALQWILDYYYRGVQSWDWYYPFHYAPFISDLTSLQDIQVNFRTGKPFLPFQQLLAVLPAASSSLLPFAYHDLMLNPESPLADFYPTEFETDLNGKTHDWEAIVLIPFIDERRLLHAMAVCDAQLTKEERGRNKHGPMFQYDYTEQSQGSMMALPPLKSLQQVFCTELARWAEEMTINLPYTVCVELPNAARHVFFPGFPTMKHLEFDFQLRHDRVKVFDQRSRNNSVVLLPKKRTFDDTIGSVASLFLEQVVYIGWPHLIKAKVESVCTRSQIVDKNGMRNNDSRHFEQECKLLEEHFTSRMGIKFHNYFVLLNIRTYAGSSVEFGPRGNVFMKDAWSTSVTPYPAQGVVANIQVQDNMRKQFNKMEQLFPVGSTVFFIGNPYVGSEGTVLDPQLVYSCGRIQVNIRVGPQPDVTEARELQNRRDRDYINHYQMVRNLNLSSKCLGRVTGTVWVVLGPRREKMENAPRFNIGLQLKFPRLNEERAGYCRQMNNQWHYSSLAVDLVHEYCNEFPDVVAFLTRSNDREDFVYEEDLFPFDVGQGKVAAVANWVRAQPHMKVDRITCGSSTVCKETVELLLTAIDKMRSQPVKDIKLQVKPHLLVKPNVTLPDVYRSQNEVRLFDRVVVVRTIYMVPVGATGIVIGVYPVTDPNPVRLECLNAVDTFCDVLFDKVIPNCSQQGIHGIAEGRVYKIPESAVVIINTTDSNDTKTPAVVQSQQQQQQQLQPQQSFQVRNKVDAMRRDWRAHYQNETRFVTAAGTKYVPTTIKTRVPEEFVVPGATDGKVATAAPTALTSHPIASTSAAAAAASAAEAILAPPQNWRTLSAVPSLQQQQQQKQQKQHQQQLSLETHRNKGGSSKGNATAATPNAQTLALQKLLGLKPSEVVCSSKESQQANSSSTENIVSQVTTQQLPDHSQLPNLHKLPQPPLFWQREAQQAKQKAKLQSEFIGTQQWDQRLNMCKQSVGEESTQPAQLPLSSSMQQFESQLKSEPSSSGIIQFQMPQISYPNSNNYEQPKQTTNYYPTNNNSGSSGNQFNSKLLGRSNNSNTHYGGRGYHIAHSGNHNNNSRKGDMYESSYNQPTPHRRTQTSIEDFVPIQAYRPKNVKRDNRPSVTQKGLATIFALNNRCSINPQNNSKQDTYFSDNAAVDDNPKTSSYTAAAAAPASAEAAAAQNTGEESSCKLMRALKITPTNTEPSTSASAPNASSITTTTGKTANTPKLTRTPRVPRIGAKFDLEYIMH